MSDCKRYVIFLSIFNRLYFFELLEMKKGPYGPLVKKNEKNEDLSENLQS